MEKEGKRIAVWRKHPNPKPEDCALIIIDLQNDFVHANGKYSKWGTNISHMVRTIKPVQKMIGFCREMKIPVIAATVSFRGPVDAGLVPRARPAVAEGCVIEGTWGCEFMDELGISREKGDWFIERLRPSAFASTRLELLLKALKRNSLICTGVVTNQCVEATLRDCRNRDIVPLELSDCVGAIGGKIVDPLSREEVIVTAEEMHHASLRAIAFGVGDVYTSDEMIEELSKTSR